MNRGIDTVATWVAKAGADEAGAREIAEYVADRCAGLTIASAYASENSSLQNDAFLRQSVGLSPRQIRAWLALVRGTRAVVRNGRTYGGCPGLVETTVRGRLSAAEHRRFERLARIAATGCLRNTESV